MSAFEETGHKVSLPKAKPDRGVEAGRRMISAPVTDQFAAARRRLTNALRLGADTAEPRAEIAMLERRVADDAADVAASNAAAARSRDLAATRRVAKFARRNLEDLLASAAAPRPVDDARDALKPDIIAGHRPAVATLTTSLLADLEVSCSVPAANVAGFAKCISALDSRRQESLLGALAVNTSPATAAPFFCSKRIARILPAGSRAGQEGRSSGDESL